jgi:glycosyltransferase involved in cell wall biosynthesis
MARVVLLYDFIQETGGLERLLFQHAQALRAEHEVEIAAGYVDDARARAMREEFGVAPELRLSQIGRGRTEWAQWARLMLHPRPPLPPADLYLCYSFLTMAAVRRAHRGRAAPYVAVLAHPPNFLYDTPVGWANTHPRQAAYWLGRIMGARMRRIDHALVRGAARVIAISRYTARRLESIYGCAPGIVYPAVSSRFAPATPAEVRAHLGAEPWADRFLLFHGRAVPDKRPDWAVEALARLRRADPRVHLVFSGSCAQAEAVHAQAARLGVGDAVHVLGRVSEAKLRALYTAARVFVLTAPREDFGLTPVEAMACGCPVVAWGDDAGPSETVEEGIGGCLARPYDVDHFAECLERALRRDWDRAAVAASARRFSESVIAQQLSKAVGLANQGPEHT